MIMACDVVLLMSEEGIHMPTTTSQYSGLPNKLVRAANGVDYAYRDTGPQPSGVPLVLFQHFRGNLDSWDPALIDALAQNRRVITFDNAGVGGSTGTTPDSVEQMARDPDSAHGFLFQHHAEFAADVEDFLSQPG
jgi:pimeloyl-ACP methyl ester carboxylesterase